MSKALYLLPLFYFFQWADLRIRIWGGKLFRGRKERERGWGRLWVWDNAASSLSGVLGESENLTSGGNNLDNFPENKLTQFCAFEKQRQIETKSTIFGVKGCKFFLPLPLSKSAYDF